jgi:hypothetical protein
VKKYGPFYNHGTFWITRTAPYSFVINIKYIWYDARKNEIVVSENDSSDCYGINKAFGLFYIGEY